MVVPNKYVSIHRIVLIDFDPKNVRCSIVIISTAARTCTHTHIHTCIHVHMYTHTHIHTRARSHTFYSLREEELIQMMTDHERR